MLSPLAKVPEEVVVEEHEQPPVDPAEVHPESEPEEDDTLPLMHPEDVEAVQRQEREQPPQEAPAEPTPSPEVQALLERIAALESRVQEAPVAPETREPEVAIPSLAEVRVLGDQDDVTDFTLSAEGMNEYGRRVINTAVQAALRLVQPAIVTEANRAIASYEYSKQFYTLYPDLRDKGDLIQELSAAVEAEDPAVTPQKLFTEVAKRAYAKLGLNMPKKRSPGFANPSGAVPLNGTPQRTRTTTDDIVELLRHKGRL